MAETATLTLTEFLLARFAEDEAVARRQEADLAREFGTTVSQLFSPLSTQDVGDMGYPVIDIDATRVLAECEAKRRIVRALQAADVSGSELGFGLDLAVRALATVYADHPDYRPEWRAND